MGRFIAEPLGEQPIGSEGSSRPALRTYFVGVYFTGTPVNIRELSGECWGRGGGCPGGLVTRAGLAIRLLAAQHEVTLRLLDLYTETFKG